MRELSLHVLDVIQNAIEAGASKIEVRIEEDLERDWMTIEVADDGRGMSQEWVEKVLNPFTTTRKTRHVGLGLPLFAEAARRCGGDLSIQSKPGKGTRIKATFRHSHIDRAPLGDISAALLAVLLSESPVDLEYLHKVGTHEFQFSSLEIRKELDDIPLTHPKVRSWLSQTLCEGEASLPSGRQTRPLTL